MRFCELYITNTKSLFLTTPHHHRHLATLPSTYHAPDHWPSISKRIKRELADTAAADAAADADEHSATVELHTGEANAGTEDAPAASDDVATTDGAKAAPPAATRSK